MWHIFEVLIYIYVLETMAQVDNDSIEFGVKRNDR
jgi:hypothetical protein